MLTYADVAGGDDAGAEYLPGAQFACFTSKKKLSTFQVLSSLALLVQSTNTDAEGAELASHLRVASTKVQMLTQLLVQKHIY